MGIAQAERKRGVPDRETHGKDPESGGNRGLSESVQHLARPERQEARQEELSGAVSPRERRGLWWSTVGVGEGDEVMAGSTFQTQSPGYPG